MKVGDIVYFKSIYTARYGKQGGSYEYHFCPGDRYRIDEISHVHHHALLQGHYTKTSGNITNLEDGSYHFAHSDIWNKLITVDEWREIQLSKIL